MYKSVFNWSGGKDSALALYYCLQDPTIEISSLLTTVSQQYERISMHGVRVSLLEEQARQLGLPLKKIMVPENPDMSTYNELMQQNLLALKSQGVQASIFGDIFLEDLKAYREQKLAEVNLKGLFPLWGKKTDLLIREFLELGFKTIVVCGKSPDLPEEFVGRTIDRDFLADLPKHIDPCGENGEFHTFVYDGPIFKSPIDFTLGEKVLRSYPAPKSEDSCHTELPAQDIGFYFQDLILSPNDSL
ncbi:hypothetical protein GCM10007049_25300 [Echinicola pacifica]|uniref:Diphthamide synthase domain-containing protein n=1 Tax=Echinicola pacifica TaxID=346377 RepID=A0A918Q577_9BACT|nr:diphthine--ammonia ligase [Echinicola pacifica]GGZ31229.1 hypothetical protein GCM10007049_25300 [Echinicola pacifica]